MPLVGWALVSASPFNIPTVLYGVVPWPHLPIVTDLPNKAAVEAGLKLVHASGAWFLIALLVLHAGAALRHHFVLRDDTLRRMLPSLGPTRREVSPR
jgi:cytochrome b561